MLKEKTLDQLIRETWMQITKLYNEEAARYGGTMSVGYVLLKIDPVLGAPSTSLAPKLGMEPTSLSRTLKKMEEKGLIYREQNPNDGRSVLIKLTDLGLKMRDKSKETVLRFNEVLNESIPSKELETFKKVSHQILELINDNKIFDK